MFLTLTMKEGGSVKFGGNQFGKIVGTGTIDQLHSVQRKEDRECL